MLTIWFIRHAQSQANAGEKTVEPASIALTPIGREQAAHVAVAFKQAPDLVIISPYLRAQQTAEYLLQRYPDVRREIWPVHEFTYLALERCRDTTVQERLPMAEEFWKRNDPVYKDGDGAESFADFMGRAATTWKRLKSEKCLRDVVIFTHAQFIKAAIWYWLYAGEHLTAKGMRRFRHFLYSFPITNGAIVRARLDPAFWIGEVNTSHIPVPLRTE